MLGFKKDMKIDAIKNYKTYNANFKSNTTIPPEDNQRYHVQLDNDNRNDNEPKKPMPDWLRKTILGGLVLWAVQSQPIVQEFLKSDELKQAEKDKNEYFESTIKYDKKSEPSPAMYHLNRLADVDNPKIKTLRNDIYKLEIPIDSGKTIKIQLELNGENKDVITGYLSTNKSKHTKFYAKFSSENPEEFTVAFRNKNNDKYVFGRNPNGELYQIKGNKKVILNSENTKKYQEYLEGLELLDKYEFFTNRNDLWRKLNLILLIYLLLNEMAYDHMKRKKENNES